MSSANTSQNETNMNNHETPLSPREICRFSRRISVDWDTLGGLMGISKGGTTLHPTTITMMIVLELRRSCRLLPTRKVFHVKYLLGALRKCRSLS